MKVSKDFYKGYPEEFYLINDLLSRLMLQAGLGKNVKVFVTTFDFINRCVNYYAIDDERKRFDDENFAYRIIDFLNNKGHNHLKAYIKDHFYHDRFKDTREYFKNELWNRTSEEEFHYHLTELYHFFPIDPEKYMDGVLKSYGWKNPQTKYAHIDSNNPCYPWLKVTTFDGKVTCTYVSQTTLEKSRRKPQTTEDPLWEPKLFWEYIYNLFTDPSFKPEDFASPPLKNHFFIAIPVFDAGIPYEHSGNLLCHIYLFFSEDKEARDSYPREKITEIWSKWGPHIADIAFNARRQELISQPIKDTDDILKDLLRKIAFVQDWERVILFGKSDDDNPQYCFKRFSIEKRSRKIEKIWDICENDNNCEDCKELLKDFKSALSQKRDVSCEGKNIFIKRVEDILDPKILPSIEDADIVRYKNYVLGFEFPEETFFPTEEKPDKEKKEAVKLLGEHYINKLIPIFDRLLIKRKVLKHSIKSAVAAIISRNHSHHIGSHVTPRTSVGKVADRLNKLGFDDRQFFQDAEVLFKEHPASQNQTELEEFREFLRKRSVSKEQWEIERALKSRLDNYIQKKADFVSEISTEPLTTTKTMSFFNEIVLPFIQNTLLMDNIGANEGVNYRKGGGAQNRLRIHVHYEGRELEARFYGGASCPCGPVTHLHYPYSGCCRCLSPSALVTEPEMKDVSVAVPGPLGEFAVYAFLENLIRNAAKHNHSAFRKNPARHLDIHVKLSDLGENDEKRDDFYRVEIWDDVSKPDKNLTERLDQLIDDPVVDRYGQLKKRAWGIAEMKIMANLLGGSGDFSQMEASLSVRGGDRLVYEFKIMKPKEIALISERFSAQDDYRKKGIWCFSSLDDFLAHQEKGVSPATFNLVILDRDVTGDIPGHSHLFPNRVLVHSAIEARLPGSVRIADEFVEAIQQLNPEGIISRAWRVWLKGLAGHSNQIEKLRPVVYFGQEDDVSPTKEWLRVAKKLAGKRDAPRLSVIYQGEDYNEVLPVPSREERLLVFDRHFDGYCVLPRDAIAFHEAFDKSSLDFVPIFSAEPSDVMVCQMAESAYLKVLVMDERISEVAYEEVLRDEGNKPKKLYGQQERIAVNKWANLFLASHLKINNEDTQPLHHSIGHQIPQILVEIATGDSEGRRTKGLQVTWFHREGDHEVKEKIKPHILIIHQQVIENFLAEKIPKKENEDLVETLEVFFEELREFVPFIVVDSGRGIPPNLPDKIKFMPFSLVEDYLMKERISKFNFMKIIMSLIRRGN